MLHEPLTKNIIVGAVFSAESPDTAGETLIVQSADISSLQSGSAPLNCEHINPEDIEKAKESSKEDPRDHGFNTIVGRVIDAKKIFSEKDCDNDMEKQAWNDLKVPLIFGYAEFFDDPKHPNAQAACAILRQSHNGNFPHMIGFSVEGNILKRDGNQLVDTVIRRLAATMKPANRASQIYQVIKDDASQNPKPDVITKASRDGSTFLTNFNGRQFYVMQDDFGLSQALRKLRKTISAGGGNAAPSAMTQGSALQSSSLDKLEGVMGSKPITRGLVSKYVPGLKEEQVGNIVKVLKQRRLTRYEKDYGTIYDRLFKVI